VRRAGAKDEAKKLARSLGNAVIPGVDDISARALLRRAKDRKGLEAEAARHDLAFAWDAERSLEENAEALLQAGYARTRELVTIAELQAEAEAVCAEMWARHPKHRIRFKHIGGGGGKGQRVVAKPREVAAAVTDVLAESKVLPPGSNRNFLVELNIETTRHNEIQLVGNGEWCLSMGGRDCSVQMHEQKLFEVSLTRELLDAEIARASGRTREILEGDRGTLERMEAEGERFGAATGLDSVSTFECIVEGFEHFFMEMNTRIQVEHGVTELVYSLRFENPARPGECFYVERLIEVMLLLSVHGKRMPRPTRVPRALSAVEVRINATNQALQPHAGGLIRSWTSPLPGELRFDQGIGAPNPDTGSFVYYNLAGAYDSNVALVLTDGASRLENYQRLAEILRRMELRGEDLHTNLDLHYGLVQWLLGKGVMAEPSTRFMQPYLAAVGALAQLSHEVDLEVAFGELLRRQPDREAREVLSSKETLLLRPLGALLQRPHLLGGFLGRYDGELWRFEGGQPRFQANAIVCLERLYHFLDMEERPGAPPSEKIWEDDQAVLTAARHFYAEIERRSGAASHDELEALFGGRPQRGVCDGDEALWRACVASHRGFQLGLELLLLIPRIGRRSGFLDLGVGEDLAPIFPDRFLDKASAEDLTRALAPPPAASADEIVTPMGGTFYAREAPHLPLLVEVGDHFEAGQPLFIIEVMKMFNKIFATFPGTVVANEMADRDGSVVRKGQVIFRIRPDSRVEPESAEARAERLRAATLALL
jgi:acetyl/propionyl-CoA carboxylase alpha subunit